MFNHLGVVEFFPEKIDEDQLFELATEIEAENFSWTSEYAEISTSFKDLARIRDLITEKGKYEIKKVQPIYRIKTPQEIDENKLEDLNNFIEKIEEVDDVDEVFLGI
jgi:transcriptional/translational regulatory protein YebC/TACO1